MRVCWMLRFEQRLWPVRASSSSNLRAVQIADARRPGAAAEANGRAHAKTYSSKKSLRCSPNTTNDGYGNGKLFCHDNGC
eukprot:871422-Pleurochrysis_carterae.AAC.1